MIQALSGQYEKRILLKVLEVSRSAFYSWASGKSYTPAVDKQRTQEAVKQLFEVHKSRYGSRRLVHALKGLAYAVGRHQVRRVLRENGLKAIQPKSFVPKTTQSNPNLKRSANLLLDMQAVERINQVWMGDITYLPLTGKTWLYLAIWMDVANRMIVGWRLGTSMEAPLVIKSLEQALTRYTPPSGLIIHTDGGGQYLDKDFRKLLGLHHCKQSMTRIENHYDNAFIESFFSRFKAELLQGRSFESETQAQNEVFEHIEIYYNRERLHSGIGYKSPLEYTAFLQENPEYKTRLKMTK